MRRLMLLAFLALFVSPLTAQQDSKERAAEILKKIDATIQQESERTRAEILELVRRELRGGAAPPQGAAAKATAAMTADAKALVTVDLLKKHAMYLASDELEGRCAGYPGADKAGDYIADVFKKAGLKPAGDNGTYFQKFRLKDKDAKNVIGVVEGTDPALKGEYVVLGAHYDHVGTSETRDYGRMGGRGDDTIWNGADDNGSGTSCMLALAQAFGEGRITARRSVVIMGFSGEEAGLVGSRHFARNPTVGPIDKCAFMLNLDMVGRNPSKPIEIHGVGSAEGGAIRKAAERAVEASGLKAKINDEVKLVGGDSDHTSFAEKRVPYAFFFSGFHADYHKPSDHPEKLAYDNMVKVATTSMDMLLEMANLAEKQKFAGRARPAFQIPDLEPPVQTRRMGVTVQELDDADCDALKLAAEQGGLRVDAVQAGSAAEGAAIKVGDVILSVAGVTLPRGQTRDELRKVLNDKVKVGKEVEIVVLRKGERVTLKGKWTE
jgi:hypothetical protein